MWIQREHGNARTRNAEVALQCLVENGSLFDNALLGNRFGYVLDGQMRGNKSYTQRLVHQNHQCLLTFAHAGFDILRMTGEVETRTLDSRFVDWGSHQHIVEFAAIIRHRFVQRLQSCSTSFLRGLTYFYLDFIVEASQQVHSSVASLLRMIDDGVGHFQIERLTMIGRYLGRTIDDRCAKLENVRV